VQASGIALPTADHARPVVTSPSIFSDDASTIVSYHLREFLEAGLVESSAAGRGNRYRLASADLDQLASLLGRLQVDAAAAA